MRYETAAGIEKVSIPEKDQYFYYKMRNNNDLCRLANAHCGMQRADPESTGDVISDLRIARARLRISMHNKKDNHYDSMLLIREINERIWELDEKERIRAHIRAMASN